jgi:[acyl-carrier-protein] S-malonyltransferase
MSERACVFAGQGAQFVGMGRDLAEAAPVRALFDRANQVLGFDLAKICFEGPDEELRRSNVCQPAIFVASVACWTAFGARYPGAAFALAAGLSLGEWTALHAAGVLDFDSTLRVLEARGRFMQQACEERPGGMISIMGATPEQLREFCGQTGLVMANLNSDQQVVLSGPQEGVAAVEKLAAAAGVKSVVLNVAGAFHSPLMASARERLGAVLAQIPFQAPRLPVLANVTGLPHASDGAAIRDAMLRQVTESVRWVDCVRAARRAGVGTFIEFGPGKVLSGLIKRIDKEAVTLNTQDLPSLEKVGAALPA